MTDPTRASTTPPAASVLPSADAPVVAPDIPIPVPDEVALVGSDLDGTLLDPQLRVGPLARATIPKLVETGVPFVYVTGRPPRWLTPVTDQTGVTGLAVCGNGSMVVDLATRRLVRATTIPTELAVAAVEHLRAHVPGITFAVERLAEGAWQRDLAEVTTFGMEDTYNPMWGRPPDADVAEAGVLLRRGAPLKLLAIPPDDSDHDNDSLVAVALAGYADLLHVTHSGARHALIEITAEGADKGAGLVEVANLLGIGPGRSVAIGDMPNDVPLLRAAGTGYAVANAHPAVRAAAAHVVPSNVDDGVGRLLSAILAARNAST